MDAQLAKRRDGVKGWVFRGLACLAGLALSAGAEAKASFVTQTYALDSSNTLSGGTNYGTVTVNADTSAGTVTITFSVNPSALPGPLNNFGLQLVGLNTDLKLQSSQVTASNGWTVELDTQQVSTFGRFNITASGSGSNRVLSETIVVSGLGSQATLDHFVIGSKTSSGGTPSGGSVAFVEHIAGFGGGTQSTFVGGIRPVAVPEPKSLALILMGAALATGLGFRRQLTV